MFDTADQSDVPQLLRLYRRVYGASYSLPLGTDPAAMSAEIASAGSIWLVARHPADGVVASIIATVDPHDRLGKVQGMVVDPAHRGAGIARRILAALAGRVLAGGEVDSLYATARTTTVAPQHTFLRNGFHPMGVFPNLRRSDRHETMVLLARYGDGVLDRRIPVDRVPSGLAGLIDATAAQVGWPDPPELVPGPEQPSPPCTDPPTAELVDAPRFLLDRFQERITDPVRRFYPFHTPNMMLVDTDYELYVHLSRRDGYCALVAAAPRPMAVAEHLDQTIRQLTDLGAMYVETLVPLHAFAELSVLLTRGFIPAALYPAMRRDGDGFRDYVVMARTVQPLDFRGLAIDAAFRPFTEQYIQAWTQQYLNTHGVYR